MERPEQQEIDRWHKWFGVECNNLAWNLADRERRTDEEEREMLSAAYAAAFHWAKVGKPVNGARADMLLSQVHSLLGEGEAALRYARRSLEFCQGNECTQWDIAFAHLQVALAAATARDAALSAQHRAEAERLCHDLEEEGDRTYFLGQLARVPTV